MANEIEKKIKEKLGVGPRLDADASAPAPAGAAAAAAPANVRSLRGAE
jgi:recombination protein RecA